MDWRRSKSTVVQLSVICTLLAAAPAPGENAREGCGYLPNPRCALRSDPTPSTAHAGNAGTDRHWLPPRATLAQKSWTLLFYDDTDGGSMSMNDMQRALDETGPVDIIAFTAPCLMGAIESAYELRTNVGFSIASEDYSGYVYWRGIFDEIAEMLDGQPQQSSAQVSAAVIDLVAHNLMTPPEYRATLTMSAVDTLELQVAVDTFDTVCAEILSRGTTMMDALATARVRVKTFAEQPDINGTIDVVDFIDELISAAGSEEMHADLAQLRDELGRAVIAEHHGSAHEGAGGLTVYFPTHPLCVSTAYRTGGLDSADQTSWLDVIAAVHAIKRPRWRTSVPGGRVP